MTVAIPDRTASPSRPRRVLVIIRIALISLLVALIVGTAISANDSDVAFVRIWDFPRLQIAILIVATYLGLAAVSRRRTWGLLVIGALAATALSYQLWRLWPYIVPHATEGSSVAVCPASDQVSVLVANVKFDNRDTAPLLVLIQRKRPDLVLLLETTAQWGEALEPLDALYPYRVAEPRPDG